MSDFPTSYEGLLYPDWKAVARHCDGVHVTLRAVGATQGICFRLSDGVVAPPYWDVETTFWLRWVFEHVEFVASSP